MPKVPKNDRNGSIKQECQECPVLRGFCSSLLVLLGFELLFSPLFLIKRAEMSGNDRKEGGPPMGIYRCSPLWALSGALLFPVYPKEPGRKAPLCASFLTLITGESTALWASQGERHLSAQSSLLRTGTSLRRVLLNMVPG